MANLVEGRHTAEFLVSADQYRSFEKHYIPAGNLAAGAVLGRSVVGAADGGNTGNGTIGTISALPNAPSGVYTITCTAESADSGTFSVTAPDGTDLGDATVGSGFASLVSFTIADGATDFTTGDVFTVTVGWVEHDPVGSDGEEVAGGLLFEATNASSSAQWAGVVVRAAQINKGEITWKSGVTDAQKLMAYAKLADAGIIAR